MELDKSNKICFAKLANKVIVIFAILILLNVILVVPIIILFSQMAHVKLKIKPIAKIILQILIIVNNAKIYTILIHQQGLAN